MGQRNVKTKCQTAVVGLVVGQTGLKQTEFKIKIQLFNQLKQGHLLSGQTSIMISGQTSIMISGQTSIMIAIQIASGLRKSS